MPDNPAPHIFDKYENKDPRCTYPFDPSPAGYCWSFAHHVDGTKGFEDMNKICPKCEYWDAGAATQGDCS